MQLEAFATAKLEPLTPENARKLSGLVQRLTRDLARLRHRSRRELDDLIFALGDPANADQAAKLRKILGGK
jgi:hypothetical protein